MAAVATKANLELIAGREGDSRTMEPVARFPVDL